MHNTINEKDQTIFIQNEVLNEPVCLWKHRHLRMWRTGNRLSSSCPFLVNRACLATAPATVRVKE